ncbi:MAG: metallophosphoesterase [Candidatus Hydrothermarchaeota archaeon]
MIDRFDFYNNSLFVKDLNICAVSDLHIGLEDESFSQGLIFPLKEKEILIERLEKIIDRFKPKKFVLNGDIFHSFEKIEWKVKEKFLSILELLEENVEDIIFVRGSHDTMLPYLAKKVFDKYDIGDITFVHGHMPFKNGKCLIIGHEHPTIEIEMVRLPCFLYGKNLNGTHIVVLPAFSPLCQGVLINNIEESDFLSPILRKVDISNLQPIVEIEEDYIVFPRIYDLRRHL